MGVTTAVMLMLIATHTHAWSSKKVCKYDEWLNKPCSAQADCKVKKAECFKGRCLCTPGYNYSISGNTCVEGKTRQTVCTTLAHEKEEVPWLERSCDSDADCPDGINAECFKGKCLCTPGYYYSNGQAVCVDNCPVSDQLSEFLAYPHSYMDVETVVLPGDNVEDCLDACAASSSCITVGFFFAPKKCVSNSFSPRLDPSKLVTNFPKSSMYQQRCA